MSNILPIELTSLVQHIQLNEAGWWDRGIRQLMLSLIWINGAMAEENLSEALSREFAVHIDAQKLAVHVQALIDTGIVVRTTDGPLKITESTLRTFEAEVSESEGIEIQVKEIFGGILTEICPSLPIEETWQSFNEALLFPVVKEMGARTYQLISGISGKIEDTSSLQSFLGRFDSEIREPMKRVAVEFLNPKRTPVRSYVLRYLNAYFFIEAGNLQSNTIDALLENLQRTRNFRLFLDTNIVFSILGFHNNPSNEAVQDLLRVVSQLSVTTRFKFYVLPVTVDETKRSLDVRKLDLQNIKLSSNIADVTAHLDDLSGASKAYAEACLKAGRTLSPDDYFGPFLTNLIAILKGRGVELYNSPNLSAYSTYAKVTDDITAQMQFQEGDSFRGKVKTYEGLKHDIVLWHVVNDTRPQGLEAPFEAEEWIVTIDYGYLAFDQFKQRFRLPVCIHPAALVQMLRLWVARTPEFESAIVNSLQFPFLFREFDIEAERVSLKILEKISMYEGIENVPTASIREIVVNDALRKKMRVEQGEEKQIELIRDAIVQTTVKLTEQLKTEQQKNREYREKIETDEARRSQDQLEKERFAKEVSEAQSQARDAERKREELSREQSAVRDSIIRWRTQQRAIANRTAMTVVMILKLVILGLLAVLVFLLSKWVLQHWNVVEPIAWIASVVFGLAFLIIGWRHDAFSWSQFIENRLAEVLYQRRLRLSPSFNISD